MDSKLAMAIADAKVYYGTGNSQPQYTVPTDSTVKSPLWLHGTVRGIVILGTGSTDTFRQHSDQKSGLRQGDRLEGNGSRSERLESRDRTLWAHWLPVQMRWRNLR